MGWLSPMLPGSLRRPTTSKRFGRIRQRREENEGSNCPDETNPLNALHNFSAKPIIDSSISNTMAMIENNKNIFETRTNSKAFVSKLMKQVLRKENPSSTSYKKSSLFRRKGRIRKTYTDVSDGRSSPTNSRTVTDESSSPYCHSKHDDSPHFKPLQISIDEAYHGHNLPPNDMYQNNKYTVDDTTGENCLPLTPISFDEVREEANVHNDELPKCHFDKSEIISMLFPLGYPSSQATESESVKEKIDFVARDDKEDTNEHVGTSSEECREEITNKSPFSRSEIASFLFPLGHPQETRCNTEADKTKASETELKQTESTETNSKETESTSSGSKNGNCDEVIGVVVSFDPTWELLTQGSDETDPTATMVKSRLRKFYEVENYSNSILGKFTEEEASKDSSDIVADVNVSFGTGSSFSLGLTFEELMAAGMSPNNSFELGYHFDHDQFPDIDSSEVEICFYSDDESIDRDQDVEETEQSEAWTREIEYAIFSEHLEFLSNMDESQDDILYFNDSNSMETIEGEIIFTDESQDDVLQLNDSDSMETIEGGIIFTDESQDDILQLNDSYSMETIEGEIIFMDESMDSSSSHSECRSQGSFENRSNPLYFLENPEETYSPQKLFLFTDKDDNCSSEWESSSATSADISSIQLLEHQLSTLHIPQLRNA